LTVLNNTWKQNRDSYTISRFIEKMIDKLVDEDGLL
jgi:hypothetical protein